MASTGEFHTFLKSLLAVSSSLCFCYSIKNSIPKGFIRFIFVLPIVFFFLFLPLQFQTIHLQGSVSFFIAWLGSFKLLLFAFGEGPLCSHASSSSLGRFLAVGCLPIEIPNDDAARFPHRPNVNTGRRNHRCKSNGCHQISETPSPTDVHAQAAVVRRTKEFAPVGKIFWSATIAVPLIFTGKCGLFAVAITAVYYQRYIHQNIVLFFYCMAIYLMLEVLLATAATVARATLGVELEPQFNEPYLSTSLQDFWGKRWNLMVSKILRPAVFIPTRRFAAPILGRKLASLSAVVATFAVSGLVHELIYFYMGRMKPTWEVTGFFLLHGLCLVVEMTVKRVVGGKFRLPEIISVPLTMGFLLLTSFWLFLPQFLRFKADVRMFEEYAAVGAFFKEVSSGLISYTSF